jgi:hypothetical protein
VEYAVTETANTILLVEKSKPNPRKRKWNKEITKSMKDTIIRFIRRMAEASWKKPRFNSKMKCMLYVPYSEMKYE